jgi:hypothetical protein
MAKRKKKAARAGRKKAAPKRKTAKKAARAKKVSSKSSRTVKRARKPARKRPRPTTATAPRMSGMADETTMEAELLPELEGDTDRMEFP